VTTHDDLAVAAGLSVDPDRWRGQFEDLMALVAGRFGRVEPRRRARAFVLGLLPGLRRKNCWTLAEQAGDATPDGMQHLLAAARWDADGVRDDLRGYVVEHLGGDPGAVLVVDETGDLKKGTASAGVQRQYTGTAGRVENCQVAVFLSYASPAGHALIDRELYLPASWTADPARCAAAGIPGGTSFATKPALARRMIARALDAGTPAAWVTADEVYGADPGLRADLERRQVGYVLAVATSHRVITGAGPCQAGPLARRLPRQAWQRYSAGAGAKGHRYYDWALVAIDPGRPGYRWLLIRRSRRTRELAFYRCYSPRHVPLPALAKIAGIRWTTEICHRWCRSSRVVLSLLCSLPVGGLGPAGAGVEARGAGFALAELLHFRGVCGDDPVFASGGVPGGDPSAVDPVVDGGGGHAEGGSQAGDRPLTWRQAG
jgi:hypothetical protein